MSNNAIAVYASALKREAEEQAPARNVTHKPTPPHDGPRAPAREQSRNESRQRPRDLPTRDEVQEFSFRLRDELKVKVQAEVPHHWQQELDDVARDVGVKKLELYRFIIGEFLGKVTRQRSP